MNGRESGQYSRDVTKAKDGRWTFWEPNARVKVGDVIHYWVYVDHNSGDRTLAYVKDDQSYTITGWFTTHELSVKHFVKTFPLFLQGVRNPTGYENTS